MRAPAVIAVVAAAVLAAGCSERAEPLDPDLDPYPLTARGAGAEPTVLERRPRRIVALTPGTAELLASLGAGERVVGVPAGRLPASVRGARTVVRRTGLVDVGSVVAAAPDLLVASPAIDEAAVAAAERRTGAALYLQPDTSVDGVIRSALELGLLIDEPVRGRRVAAAVTREVAEIDALVGGRPPVRVFVDLGFLATVSPDSLVADLVRRAGGEPLFDPAAGLGRRAACQVLDLRPDVLLRIADERSPAPSPRRLLRRCPNAPRALRRVGRVPAALATRAGPRVGDAVVAVARVLHPDAFP